MPGNAVRAGSVAGAECEVKVLVKVLVWSGPLMLCVLVQLPELPNDIIACGDRLVLQDS